MATKHTGKAHVLYEICNEPNGVNWCDGTPGTCGNNDIFSYATKTINTIRAYDKDTVIIVGTP